MLNKDWKDKFVEETDNDYAIKYFKLISNYEDGIGKDLSSFSTKEIIDFYKILSSRSFTFLANCNYSLVRYTRWCLKNSLVPDGQNHYEEIDNSIVMECLNHLAIENSIVSYEDLIKQEDILENVSDACLVQAVFEGICGLGYAELSELHVNQIHGRYLHLNKREIKISERLIGLMQQSSDTYDGISMNTIGSPQKMTYKESDTRVFKDNTKSRIDTDEKRRVRIYRKLFRVQDFLDGSKAFTFGNLRKSGLIHMVKRLMIEDGTPAYETILNHRGEIENQYSKVASIKQFVMVYGKYLEE